MFPKQYQGRTVYLSHKFPDKKPITKEFIKEKLRERRKKSKEVLKQKRARLVLKNLPFKATEENLKEYFEKFGEVVSVDLLKKPDGKLVGCGFVQFKLVQKAAKAKHHTNGKQFLGRELNVDFAKPKNKFVKELKQQRIKIENEIKEEPIDVDAIKEEKTDEKPLDNDIKTEDSVESNSDGDDEEIQDEEDDNEGDIKEETQEQRPRVFSNDITEGKTVFIKNVPFSATNDDLKECMSQYGPLYYALICMDKLTEHSKGTAFVKFRVFINFPHKLRAN